MTEPLVYKDFSMDCPNCGPGTWHVLNGERVPHRCDYEPPSVIIDCADHDDEA